MEQCEDRPFYLLAGVSGDARFQLLSLKEVIRLTEDERQRVAASYRLSAASRRCCRGYTATFSWVTEESPNKQQRYLFVGTWEGKSFESPRCPGFVFGTSPKSHLPRKQATVTLPQALKPFFCHRVAWS